MEYVSYTSYRDTWESRSIIREKFRLLHAQESGPALSTHAERHEENWETQNTKRMLHDNATHYITLHPRAHLSNPLLIYDSGLPARALSRLSRIFLT